ncbi:MAG: hypothetical protein HXX14_15500 [Bacteroidetes bacterium]|nr:hypothetical protein [Bacteroidota bacterium]
MENNNVKITDKTVSDEYQIPELVDLNNISETQATNPHCTNGSSNGFSCSSGTSGPI